MAEWIEVTAASVDAARERALDLLGITIDEIDVEIVNEESKQLFGLRRTDARIRARVRPRTPPPKDDGRRRRRSGRDGRNQRRGRGGDGAANGPPGGGDDAPQRTRTAKGARNRRRSSDRGSDRQEPARVTGRVVAEAGAGASSVRRSARSARDRGRDERVGGQASRGEPTRRRRLDVARQIPRRAGGDPTAGDNPDAQEEQEQMDTDETSYQEQAETVGDFLEGVLDTFGLEGRVEVGTVDEEEVEINVDGDDLGLLIGPRGQTMTALHELAKTVLQRTAPTGPRVRLRLDVAGYRQKRREALGQFVRTQAAEVLVSGKARALEPMNASDRKVVHDTVNDIDGIQTESEGEEPRRRVVLVPDAPA